MPLLLSTPGNDPVPIVQELPHLYNTKYTVLVCMPPKHNLVTSTNMFNSEARVKVHSEKYIRVMCW
jgi:hypothetical protein